MAEAPPPKKTKPSFICDDCQQTFTAATSLERHISFRRCKKKKKNVESNNNEPSATPLMINNGFTDLIDSLASCSFTK